MQIVQARVRISCPCSLGMLTAHTSVGLNFVIFVSADMSFFLHPRSAHIYTQRAEKSGAAGISYVVTLASQKPSTNISHGVSAIAGRSNSVASTG